MKRLKNIALLFGGVVLANTAQAANFNLSEVTVTNIEEAHIACQLQGIGARLASTAEVQLSIDDPDFLQLINYHETGLGVIPNISDPFIAKNINPDQQNRDLIFVGLWGSSEKKVIFNYEIREHEYFALCAQ